MSIKKSFIVSKLLVLPYESELQSITLPNAHWNAQHWDAWGPLGLSAAMVTSGGKTAQEPLGTGLHPLQRWSHPGLHLAEVSPTFVGAELGPERQSHHSQVPSIIMGFEKCFDYYRALFSFFLFLFFFFFLQSCHQFCMRRYFILNVLWRYGGICIVNFSDAKQTPLLQNECSYPAEKQIHSLRISET